MRGLGFEEPLESVPIHSDKKSTLHVAVNKIHSAHAKHLTLRLCCVRDRIPEGNKNTYGVPTELNIRNIGTKFLSKHRCRCLIGLINNFKA